MKLQFLKYISLFVIFSAVAVLAGTLTPSHPTSTATMYSLSDINNLIVNNITTTSGNHTVSTTSTPTTTPTSLSLIYANLGNLIQQENIKTGVTYLGITGNFGVSNPSRYTFSTTSTSLTPPSSPTATGFSLTDIYNLITDNSTTTLANHSFTNSSTVATTSYTLSDIYTTLSTLIQPEEVASGTTYLGVLGTYKILSSIAITTPANKLSYTVGESLDITGLVITGTYSDSSTATESITADNVTGFDSSVPVEDQVLTVTVSGKTTTYTVDIVAASVPAPSNLIVHNKMNDNSTDAIVLDSVGGSDGFATANTNTLSTSGKINTALNFDGGNVINYSGVPWGGLSAGSISLWIYVPIGGEPAPGYEEIINTNAYTTPRTLLRLGADGALFWVTTPDSYGSTSVGLVAFNNSWYHITMTWDTLANSASLYLNGVEVSSSTCSAPSSSTGSGSLAREVTGGNYPYSGYWFVGKIDDFRVYDKALNQTDIDYIYNSGNGTED